MYKIDLNSDIGESFGAYKLGDDATSAKASGPISSETTRR